MNSVNDVNNTKVNVNGVNKKSKGRGVNIKKYINDNRYNDDDGINNKMMMMMVT